MTVSVTIRNNGPVRINVNVVEPVGGKEQTVESRTLSHGETTAVEIRSNRRYLCVVETNDVDTPADELSSAQSDDEHYDRQGYCDNPGRGY